MNALELLIKDHEKVSELFEQVKATEDQGKKQQLFEQIKEELEIHTHIEETIFYPALQQKGNQELTEIVLEGIEEHHQAKIFLREISSLSDDSEKFDAKLKVLMEDVEHHVDEEENEMFSLVEEVMEESELEELGKALEAEKQTFKKSYRAGAGS
jgi:hemerythrin superfamily protein